MMLNIDDIRNTVICGDCLEVMKQMQDKCVDLTVTSPPYDNLRTYNGYSFDFEGIAKELFRITKEGGVAVWVVGNSVVNGGETGTAFRQALYFKDIGFSLHDTMIYWKNSFAFPEQTRYAQVFEYMFVFSKGSPSVSNIARVPTNQENRVKNKVSYYRKKNGETAKMKSETGKDDRNMENIWIYECGFMKTTKYTPAYEHPAMFPEQLAIDHIRSWSNEGDLILDCFSGSGTTAVACYRTRREYIGIEISPEYCEIARKRLQAEKDKLALFEGMV